VTIDADVDHAVVIKLDRVHYLSELARKDKLETRDESNPIEFFPSLDGKPSLPSWLSMEHPSFYEDAYLYGTPSASVISRLQSGSQHVSTVRLCVIALHKELYSSVTRYIDIRLHFAPTLSYQVQLVLLNHRLFDFLSESLSSLSSSSSLRRILMSQWEDDVSLVHVSSSSSSSSSRGVIAHFGSAYPMHERLKSYAVKASVAHDSHQCKDESMTTKDLNIEGPSPMFAPKYVVDWCRFRIVEKAASDSSKSKHSASYASRHRPRSLPLGASPPHRFDDFVLFVILPAMVLVIVVVLLACFMFGHRNERGDDDDKEIEDRQHTTATTSQLRRYNSIRQASESLRLLSSTSRINDASISSAGHVGDSTMMESTLSSIPANSSILQRRFQDRPQLVARSQSFAYRAPDAADLLPPPPITAGREFSNIARSTVNTVDGRMAANASYANPLYAQQFAPFSLHSTLRCKGGKGGGGVRNEEADANPR